MNNITPNAAGNKAEDIGDLINLPHPARLITGLRDTGYDFLTAAADIVDNSIAASATNVNIDVVLHEDGRKQVFFGDNGCGMLPGQLKDAMRYGAPKRSSAKSLGKFGLGLKTASSAICRKFTIISRVKETDTLGKLSWDIDHVAKVNKWEMVQEPVTSEEHDKYDEHCGKSGTLVIWSNCDKLLGKEFNPPGGSIELKAINNKKKELCQHLGMVFHKFLDSANDQFPTINITVGGVHIAPWNPFFPERSEQMLCQSETVLEIECLDNTISKAELKAWILPHSNNLTPDEKDKARISSRNQGFYIYREGRMIHNGGWLGIFRSDDPHWSLFRAEFCFNHELDQAFQVDVKKSRINFDPAIQDELKKRLYGPYREAERRYRRIQKESVLCTDITHKSSNIGIDKVKGRTKKPTIADANASTNEATLQNANGIVKIKTPVQNEVSLDTLYVEAVTDITSGHLWEPALRSASKSNYSTGVRLNKHHDFYSKVYVKAAANGYTVEGIDYLLWALSTAEFNHNSEELRAMFEDLREEISSNLKKLLADVPMPDEKDLSDIGEKGAD